MAKYIDIEKIEYPYMTMSMWGLNSKDCHAYNEGVKAVEDKISALPAADVVSMGVLEQVRWERDVAIDQLAEYGIGFAEKKKDLVEVVRCKDCKYCMVEGKRYKSYYCDFHSNEAWGGVYVELLDFCPYGERKVE